ncbi:MAG: lipopolysaccharide transport periplasmic protein LptA [Rhodanobacteraceae bacterium]
MSMPRSRRIRARIDLVILLAAALGMAGVAQAKQSDKNQPLNLNAVRLVGSQQNGKLVVSGNVTMDQGTFHADGDQATGYSDPNDTSQWQRVVLTGGPAHFRQTQDSGMLVHGQAGTIDYKVSENKVVLTGDATVTQEGRGTFHGAKLTYDTDTGAIEGNATEGNRVHITLQPRKPAPAAAKPASSGTAAPAATSSPAAAPAPADTSIVPPASPVSSGAATPASTGIH